MIESCWLLFAYLTPIFGALPPDNGIRRLIADTHPAHYEGPPYMPWMPRIGIVPAGSCNRPSHVIRDGYRSIQVNVDRYGCNIPGDAANEPSIAIDPTDPRKIVIGWRQFDSIESDFRQAGYAYSHDAGHTWVFPGSLTPGVFGSDPVLAADADGNIYYLSISFDEMRLFKSSTGGSMWAPPTPVVSRFVDKPWMTVDRSNSPGRGNIYIAAQVDFFRSMDGGASFDEGSPGVAWPTLCVDRNGWVYIGAAGPISGTVVQIITNAADPLEIPVVEYFTRIDFGGGVYFGGPPNPGGLLGQLWVSVAPPPESGAAIVYVLGSVGFGSRTDPVQVGFSRSSDKARTWSPAVVVNDDPPDNGAWHWFSMMSVSPNGRIDAVWNDTRNYTDAPSSRLSELYYSYSADAGDHWSPNVPVSPVFDSHVGWPQQNKLGDYYHMLSDNLGVNVAYAATFNGEQDVYFLRIGPWDCNGNEIPDDLDIEAMRSLDCNANEVPDECEYRGDFDGDRLTTLRDIAAFQNCFTGSTSTLTTRPTKPITARTETLPDPCCGLFDLEPDGDVDSTDLTAIERVLSGP